VHFKPTHALRAGSRSRFIVVCTFVMLPAACNMLLGFGDYKGEAQIDTDAGLLDSGSPDAGVDAEIKPPTGTVAQSWARWRMPYRKETAGDRLDAGTGAFIGNTSVSGVDMLITVSSSGSKLAFHTEHGSSSSFEGARAYCEKRGTTKTEYRLPTRIELVTLLDYEKLEGPDASPTLFPVNGTNVQKDNYWTSSYVQPITNPVQHWFVNTSTGEVTASPSSGVFASGVVCIRGPVQ
jgi:hypothetical protein